MVYKIIEPNIHIKVTDTYGYIQSRRYEERSFKICFDVKDKVTFNFSNPGNPFNGSDVAVWEWMRNFNQNFTRDIINYPFCDLN